MKIFVLTLCLLWASCISASEADSSSAFWEDAKESFSLLVKGSYTQFTTKTNLYHAAWGVPATWYAFEHDDRIQSRYGGGDIPNVIDHVGDLGVILNFPVLHSAFYYWGKKTGNNHHVQFAKEYFASMYLALLEASPPYTAANRLVRIRARFLGGSVLQGPRFSLSKPWLLP